MMSPFGASGRSYYAFRYLRAVRRPRSFSPPQDAADRGKEPRPLLRAGLLLCLTLLLVILHACTPPALVAQLFGQLCNGGGSPCHQI